MKTPNCNGKSLKIRFHLSCLLDGEGKINLESCSVERRGSGNRERRQRPRIVSTSIQGLRRFTQLQRDFLLNNVGQFFPNSSNPVHILRQGNRLSLRYVHPVTYPNPQQLEVFSIGKLDDLSESKPLDKELPVRQLMNPLHIESGEVRDNKESEEIKNRRVAILEKTPNFIAMTNANGLLLYLNPIGRSLMGVAEDADISGLSLLDCHSAASRENLSQIAMPTAERYGIWSGNSILLTSLGSEIPTTQVMIAHYDDAENLKGYSVIEQDVSVWTRSENALRFSQDELQRLSDQLITIQETERQRIAADLHDCLGQYLSLIKMSLEDAIRQVDDGAPAEAAEALKRLIPKVKDTLTEVRRISMDLRPSTLDDLGILATLSWFFREFEEHCRTIKVERDIAVMENEIPHPAKISIFRIIQEAINNIVKHAEASLIRISLKKEKDLLRMLIEDNGKGFDPIEQQIAQPTPEGGGLGLLSMKERAHLSGGNLTLESAPGNGTRINIWWPLEQL